MRLIDADAFKEILGTDTKIRKTFCDIIDRQPTALDEKVFHMIYYAPFTRKEEDFFDKIEQAIGFKLFVWQKTFIINKTFRRFGKTTAECLRELLTESGVIDYSYPPFSKREAFHRKELMRIKEILDNAGIETNIILKNKQDAQAYYNNKPRFKTFEKEYQNKGIVIRVAETEDKE